MAMNALEIILGMESAIFLTGSSLLMASNIMKKESSIMLSSRKNERGEGGMRRYKEIEMLVMKDATAVYVSTSLNVLTAVLAIPTAPAAMLENMRNMKLEIMLLIKGIEGTKFS
jgi:hypothetical protein